MKEYWLRKPGDDVAKYLAQYHTRWESWISNPIASAWVRNQITYYSPILDPAAWDTSLVYEGEQGELVKMQIPQARALARQFVALTTKQRLAFNCVALSKGADVAKATRLANALTGQIVEEQMLEKKREDLAELAFIHGTSYIGSFWRTDRGREFSAGPSGEMLYDGDLDMRVFGVFDVYYDYKVENWSDLDWVEIRRPTSRWSLVAQFPEMRDEILALPPVRDWRGVQTNDIVSASDDDTVFVFEVYARPTPALPAGRMLMYSDERTIYHDGENVYGGIPLEVCKPEPVIGTAFGYPLFSNLVPAQEMLDHSFSAVATNQAAFAVQSVTIPRGAGVSVQQIQGMNFIHFTPTQAPGGGKPEALQLSQSSPETFKFMELLRSNMQEISNINSALRGSPPPGVTAGAAIATLTTNAMEFLTSFSKSVDIAVERAMLKAINAYRKFATLPHLVSLAGPQGKTVNKEFVGSDLDPIKNVKINAMNPVMLTAAGRADLADKLLQTQLIKSPKQYISIMEGEPVQSLYETELSENDLIQSENESLMDGEEVIALMTDDHPDHIRRHHALLNDPVIRRDGKAVRVILAHIEKHYALANDQEPRLAAMLRTGMMPEGPPPAQTGMAPEGGPPAMGPGAGSTATSAPAEPADDLLDRGGVS